MLDAILKIGSVISVKGRGVDVSVDKMKNASHLVFNGEVIKNVSVGSFIKISKGFSELIGKIEGESIVEDKSVNNSSYTNSKEKIKRVLNISLVGFIENKVFKQGIKELPLIDNECYLLTETEFNIIHKFITDEEKEDVIKIGALANETGVSIELSVNNLFASHIGIFGNTGSGKSYTLAKLYHELFKKYKDNQKFKENARFVLIDFNGEYVNPDGQRINDNVLINSEFKEVYHLNTGKIKDGIDYDKFPISRKIIYDVSFWSILLKATEQTQKPFLESTFKNNFLLSNIENEEGVKRIISSTLKAILTQITATQDKNLHIFFLDELLKFEGLDLFPNLNELKSYYVKNLRFWADKNDRNFQCPNQKGTTIYSNKNLEDFIDVAITSQLKSIKIEYSKFNDFHKIRLIVIFSYFYSIQKGFNNREHISPLINRLESKISQAHKVFKVAENDKPKENDKSEENKFLIIISLKDVNVEMRKLIPLVICKEYYDEKKEKSNKEKYLNFIVDEAHNILSRSSIRESETWKDYRLETFEEIIKEGRKFGVFLTIASQRPNDISSTIISQLHNYFLHRLINNKDIEAIEKTVSYLDKVSFESIPILPQGTCILAGLAAQLPVIINVDEIKGGGTEENPIRYKPYNETITLTKNWK